MTVGNADELREMAQTLDKVRGNILNTYIRKSKNGDEKKIGQMMTDETWLTAEEALDAGLIDRISDALPIAASFDLTKFGFKKVPERVKSSMVGDSARQKLARMSMKVRKFKARGPANEDK